MGNLRRQPHGHSSHLRGAAKSLFWFVCYVIFCYVWYACCMVGLSHKHMYSVFFACPELMLMHCQLTPRMSTQCALHYTCTLCHMTDLYLLNCIYIISTTLAVHFIHMTTYCSGKKHNTAAFHRSTPAGHTTTHWDNFRTVATDVSDEYDNMCVYMLTPNTLWLHWLQFTQPSRQMAYTVCTCCVQLA